jgi:ABC-2 type transport system permease protein
LEAAENPRMDNPGTRLKGSSLMERLRQNPVILKEMRARMRGNRAFVLITVYLLALSLAVGSVYLLLSLSNTRTPSAADRQVFGKLIFGMVIWMQLMTASFIAPALTAGAISSEREHQTYDLLRTTLLPARSLVLGKFFSSLLFIFLLLFAALPLDSLAFLIGGVAPEELAIGTLLLIVTSITFCAVGVFFSSFVKRTLISTVLAYAFATILVFGLPLFLVMLLSMFSSLFSGIPGTVTPTVQAFLVVIGWILVSVNPMATVIASEIVLIQEQSVFLFKLPLNGLTITLVSPWFPYVCFYLLVSLVLLAQSIRFVKRVEK